MKQTRGDIWDYAKRQGVDAICIFTNMTVVHERLIMGAGMALQARELFPILPNVWGEEYARRQAGGDFRVIAFWAPIPTTPALVSFPTKVDPRDNSDLSLIKQAAEELVEIATFRSWDHIVLGRPGCGLGRLNWEEQVEPLLEPIFDDRFMIITNE